MSWSLRNLDLHPPLRRLPPLHASCSESIFRGVGGSGGGQEGEERKNGDDGCAPVCWNEPATLSTTLRRGFVLLAVKTLKPPPQH
jgi:hypothetical protein